MTTGVSKNVKRVFLKSGIYGLIRRLFPNPRVAILRYHAVVDDQNNDYTSPAIAISPEDFENHVQFFSKNYQVLSLDSVIDCLQQKNMLPTNGVVFTFDDGYADNFVAAQLLRQFDVNGTFFVTTEPIEGKSRFWLVEVIYLIKKTSRTNIELSLGNYRKSFNLGDSSSRWKATREVIGDIKSNDKNFREEILGQLMEQIGGESSFKQVESLMLTMDQVKNMGEMGMVIGSHTLTHLNLPNADPDDAHREISESKTILESQLRMPIRHFSYPNSGPYDYYNNEIREMVIKSGYDSSCTSGQGFVDESSDQFALQRIRTVGSIEEVVHSLEWERILG